MISEACKIFVAAYTQTYAIIVFTDSDHVSELVGLHSPMVGDIFDHGVHPPSDGLWMWVGRVRCDDDEGGAEFRFEGEWRRPTDAEALAAAAGENPCLEPCG